MTNNERLRFDGVNEKRETFGLIDTLGIIAGAAAGGTAATVIGREMVKQTGKTIRTKMHLDAKAKKGESGTK
jgi:hypothetical protein